MEESLLREFKIGARREWLSTWGRSLPNEAVDDITQDLVVEYMSKPAMRQALACATNARHRGSIIRNHASQLFSKVYEESLRFDNQNIYSIAAVKDSLKGKSDNIQLGRLMGEALEELAARHRPFLEAIKARYVDGEVPAQGADAKRLQRALEALTEEVNRASRRLNENRDGPSIRNVVPAENRKGKGATSDPTAAMALAVIANDEVREAFYEDAPLAVPHRTIQPESKAGHLNIFDPELQGMPRLDMYRAMVFPDLYPNEKVKYGYRE